MAVKRIDTESMKRDKNVDKLLKILQTEAELMQELNHKNVVKGIDIFKS